MSRAVARSERIAGDAYYTPDDVAALCVSALPAGPFRHVVEPSVGGGAFARALLARYPGAYLTGVDVNPGAAGFALCDARVIRDFSGVALWRPVDAVIGNPPYSHAQEHVEHAIGMAPVAGFLLRLAFLEGQKRSAFWREHPPAAVHVLSRRPGFTGGGTDSAAYGFFVWDASHAGPAALGWL